MQPEVHSRHLDPAEHDLDARLSEDGVERAGKLAVAVPDQEPSPDPGILKVHDAGSSRPAATQDAPG